MYSVIVNPKNNKIVNITSKEGHTIIQNYINHFIKIQESSSIKNNVRIGGATQKSDLEEYYEWEKEIIKQIHTVYNNPKIKGALDKQVLEYMITFSKKHNKIITCRKDTRFIRTANSKKVFPHKDITFMNCNGRGNYKISGSKIDSVAIINTIKELEFADLTFISFLLGCQIKAGQGGNRGIFSSCCRSPDIKKICHKLGVDGIINLDSVDNVLDTDFVKTPVIGDTLPQKYKKYIDQDIVENRCSLSYNPDTDITECTYPEFIIVDYSDKITYDMMSFNDFYTSEAIYSKNYNDYKLEPYNKIVDTLKKRGARYIGLPTLPFITADPKTNRTLIEEFYTELMEFLTAKLKDKFTPKDVASITRVKREEIGLQRLKEEELERLEMDRELDSYNRA